MTTGSSSAGSSTGSGRAALGGTCLSGSGTKTVHGRHRRWSGDGTLEQILGRLALRAAGPGDQRRAGHDSLALIPLMNRLRIAPRGRGRPRTRPGRVLRFPETAAPRRTRGPRNRPPAGGPGPSQAEAAGAPCPRRAPPPVCCRRSAALPVPRYPHPIIVAAGRRITIRAQFRPASWTSPAVHIGGSRADRQSCGRPGWTGGTLRRAHGW